MDVREGRIRANHLDIELDQAPVTSNMPQQLKQYNMLTLPHKIQLWLIVVRFFKSLITNLTSIASSFYLLQASNLTCKCPPWL